ncbi:MAG TPA: glycosyltransferase [Gammaproteobacteria bacterium]|nr:glycosyltransferase [Gammaproteobacteria bacterium]
MSRRRLRILTWHVHGNYLYYLSQCPCDFFLPVKPGMPPPPGYCGRTASFRWGDNLHEVPAGRVGELDFDCILFQSKENYLRDQHEILTPRQQALPRIYLEHDPPRESPVDTRHVVDDPEMLLVHVTHFNNLMWNNNRTPTRVIEHGVLIPDDARYEGSLERGVVAINNLRMRGRRLGLDVFEKVSAAVPLDLVGMGSEELGGLGEVAPMEFPRFIARYRFFFNPIRYTSMGLAVCEAMAVGMPIVALATTEVPTIVQSGVSGYVHTDIGFLIDKMKLLLKDPDTSGMLGAQAAAEAGSRFNIGRFAADWTETFYSVAGETARRKTA